MITILFKRLGHMRTTPRTRIGAEVSGHFGTGTEVSRAGPKCLVAEVSGNPIIGLAMNLSWGHSSLGRALLTTKWSL